MAGLCNGNQYPPWAVPFFQEVHIKDLGKDQRQQEKQMTSKPIHIAIFASGAGSNARRIIEYFKEDPTVEISLVVCNKQGAGVLQVASDHHIPAVLIERERFFRGDGYLPDLEKHRVDLLVLAGFLWKVPEKIIRAYPGKIINIHPALLPAYGGKGMYGHHVHEAVLANREPLSGITIHYVDEHYDHGDTIFQATCRVEENDTVESLSQKIHQLEHAHYPEVIAGIIKKQKPR